ncbi:MAG: hypothetical protein C5B49_15530 [Bdellovibrio sp.]|nr:MAG: hypothetical protein C5B49_15530 [Bdellovibrio sp.]
MIAKAWIALLFVFVGGGIISTAYASSVYDNLEYYAGEVASSEKQALLKVLFLGLDALTPEERKSLHVEDDLDTIRIRPASNDLNSLFVIEEPVQKPKDSGASETEESRGYVNRSVARGLVVDVLDPTDDRGRWDRERAIWLRDLLEETRRKHPSRLRVLDPGLMGPFANLLLHRDLEPEDRRTAFAIYFLYLEGAELNKFDFWEWGPAAVRFPQQIMKILQQTTGVLDERKVFSYLLFTVAALLSHIEDLELSGQAFERWNSTSKMMGWIRGSYLVLYHLYSHRRFTELEAENPKLADLLPEFFRRATAFIPAAAKGLNQEDFHQAIFQLRQMQKEILNSSYFLENLNLPKDFLEILAARDSNMTTKARESGPLQCSKVN